MKAQYKAGAVVGGWTLQGLLGTGGTGEVWLASDGTQTVALKLVARKPETEAYQRFAREVTAAASLQHIPGVLPVLGTYLPDNPSRRDPAWIAMPVATPVREALADASLEAIVEAARDFAITLASLATEGASHRDIKPGNLYRYGDAWSVGDFGLVSLPEAEGLTENRLGPFGYLPDEMFENANKADGRAVDVFQLAKTLSVLVARQEYPPQGHIPAGSSGSLSRFAVHPRIRDLDELVDRCTRRDPSERPAMHAVAEELDSWLNAAAAEEDIPDLADVAARFRAANADDLAARSRVAELEQQYVDVVEEALPHLLTPVLETLTSAGLTPVTTTYHEMQNFLERTAYAGTRPTLAAHQRWAVAEYGRVDWPEQLAVGVGFDLNDEGLLWIAALVAAGDMKSTATKVWQFEDRTVDLESPAARSAAIESLRQELMETLREALLFLAER